MQNAVERPVRPRNAFTARKVFAALVVGALSLFPAGFAAAEEVALTFVTVNPPNGHLNVNVFHPWAARINEAGKGIVRIDVKDGTTLANFGNIYNRVLEDVIQIGWGLQGIVAGKFPLSEMMALPFLYDNSADASAAFWRLYKSGALDSEYNEIVPLLLTGLAQSSLHFAKVRPSADDIAGAKIVVSSKVPGETVTRLGGTPLSIPLTDMYEALQRGTADGASAGWSSFSPWKLGEVTTHHIDTALGGAPGMVFMSKKKWDALPEAARKIIMDNSGEALSRAMGAATDRVIEEQRAAVKADAKHQVVALTADQAAAWRAKLEPMIAEWAKARPQGEAVLARYRGLYADVKAGK